MLPLLKLVSQSKLPLLKLVSQNVFPLPKLIVQSVLRLSKAKVPTYIHERNVALISSDAAYPRKHLQRLKLLEKTFEVQLFGRSIK